MTDNLESLAFKHAKEIIHVSSDLIAIASSPAILYSLFFLNSTGLIRKHWRGFNEYQTNFTTPQGDLILPTGEVVVGVNPNAVTFFVWMSQPIYQPPASRPFHISGIETFKEARLIYTINPHKTYGKSDIVMNNMQINNVVVIEQGGFNYVESSGQWEGSLNVKDQLINGMNTIVLNYTSNSLPVAIGSAAAAQVTIKISLS